MQFIIVCIQFAECCSWWLAPRCVVDVVWLPLSSPPTVVQWDTELRVSWGTWCRRVVWKVAAAGWWSMSRWTYSSGENCRSKPVGRCWHLRRSVSEQPVCPGPAPGIASRRLLRHLWRRSTRSIGRCPQPVSASDQGHTRVRQTHYDYIGSWMAYD